MEVFWMLQMVLVLLLPSAIYGYRHRGDRERAVKGASLALAVTYTVVFGFFISGETAFELRGWRAVGLTALWLVPMLGLAWLAWYRPQPAAYILAGLLAVVAVIYLWSAFAATAWRGFEDVQGPVRGVISFALVGPISLLGWRKPRLGGIMLLVLAALPVVVVLAGLFTAGGSQGWPLMIVSAPAALIGLLYLVPTRMGRRSAEGKPTPTPDIPVNV